MNHLFNQTTKASIALYYGVVALSTGSIFVRWIGQEISPEAIVFTRFLLGVPVFGLSHIGQRIFNSPEADSNLQDPSVQLTYTYQEIGYLMGAGIAFASSLTLLVFAITQTNIATAVVLHNLSPIFIGLVLRVLFGQSLNWKFLLGMMVALAGVVIVEWGELHISPQGIWGDAAALVSSLFLAAYFICLEQARSKFSSPVVQMWVCGSGALALLLLLIWTQNRFVPASPKVWLLVFALTITCQFTGHGLLTYSLQRLSSVIVSLVHLLEPIFSGIFAWLIFQESLSIFHGVGLIVILTGLYLAIASQTPSRLEASS
jgi:drug/metabolite transporter (DMT)-like permease